MRTSGGIRGQQFQCNARPLYRSTWLQMIGREPSQWECRGSSWEWYQLEPHSIHPLFFHCQIGFVNLFLTGQLLEGRNPQSRKPCFDWPITNDHWSSVLWIAPSLGLFCAMPLPWGTKASLWLFHRRSGRHTSWKPLSPSLGASTSNCLTTTESCWAWVKCWWGTPLILRLLSSDEPCLSHRRET